MALVRKDTMVQFRVPRELLEDYRYWCETKQRKTVSQELREYMEWRVDAAQKAGLLPARSIPEAQEAEVVAAPPPGQPQATVAAVVPVVQHQVKPALRIDEDGEVENRKQRRERDRRARKGR